MDALLEYLTSGLRLVLRKKIENIATTRSAHDRFCKEVRMFVSLKIVAVVLSVVPLEKVVSAS